MKTKEEILTSVFDAMPQYFQTPRQDLQLAIILNPDLAKIEQAMELYDTSQNEARDKEIVELKKKYEDAFELINELDRIPNTHPTTKRIIANYLNQTT